MSFKRKKTEESALGTLSAPAESLDRAGSIRRRLLAITLPLTALFYMSAAALNPKGTDQLITTTAIALKVLPIASKHSGELFLSGSLTEIALAGLALSYFAIATLVRHRSSTLATVAAIIGAIGAFCGIVTNVLVGINLATVSTAHLTNLQAAQFLTTSFNSGAGKTFLTVYAFSEFLAPILMAIALWRSKLVSRWLSALFLVGSLLAEQTASIGAVRVIAMMLLFIISMSLLAVQVWRSASLSSPINHDNVEVQKSV
ncbi:MAG: hypothetical protein WDN07_00045 [Actinomycetota bacterium]